MFIQVPNAKSLIPRCRNQNQTATGCEAEISHDILMAGKIQKQEPCLYLPNLDLPIVEPSSKDQARDVWHLRMVASPEFLAGWRRPWAEGQAPDNLPTVQCLLLWAASPFCLIFAASTFGFKPFRDELLLQRPGDQLHNAVSLRPGEPGTIWGEGNAPCFTARLPIKLVGAPGLEFGQQQRLLSGLHGGRARPRGRRRAPQPPGPPALMPPPRSPPPPPPRPRPRGQSRL